MRNSSVKEVLNSIEKESKIAFLYSESLIDVERKVDVIAKKNSIENVLGSIFEGTNVGYSVNNRFIILTTPEVQLDGLNIFQKNKPISGTVTYDNGEPLPGVAINVKGTTIGTITDVDGKFTISDVSENTVLVFSFIGMETQEVVVGNRSTINISMVQSTTGLGEVIVTALGVSKSERSIGYAVSELDGQEFSEVALNNPISGLMGKVSGVQVDQTQSGTFGSPRINIRGISTLGNNNNNQPIFVVDGIILDNETAPYGGWGNELKNLNPADFESVTILKGAAATALYGSRALHGVVQIQTKKGKAQKGIGVNFQQTFGVRDVIAPDFQNIYGSGRWAQGAGTFRPDHFDTRQFDVNSDGEPFIRPYNASSWGPKMEGQRVRDYDNTWTTFDPQPNNFRDAFETGLHSNTSIDLQGGNEKATFYLSYSHLDEKGVELNNDMRKDSYSIRTTYNLTPWLRADASLAYANSLLENPPTHRMAYAFGYDYWPRSYNTERWRDDYKAPHGGLANQNFGDVPNAPGDRLWFEKNEWSNVQNEETLRGVFKLNADISPNWNVLLESNFYNFYTENEEKRLGLGYANSGGNNNMGGLYWMRQNRKLQSTIKGMLNYTNSWDKFEVNSSIGAERWRTGERALNTRTQGGLVVPGNFSLNNSQQTQVIGGGIFGEREFQSIYAFASFSYDYTFFLDVTGRNDWASALTYTDGSGDNSYFYPSVSSSWVFSETVDLPSWVDFGKLRASWANVGNDATPYLVNPGYGRSGTLVGFTGDIPLYAAPSNLADANLRPEQKTSVEVGMDIRLFNGRLRLDAALYRENTTDQIVNFGVPETAGTSGILINGGEIENRGFEIDLGSTLISSANFRWDLNLMASRNRTEIISLFPGVESVTLRGNPNSRYTEGSVATVGGAYGDIMTQRAYKPYQAFNAEGQPIDHPNNGQRTLLYDSRDRVGYYAQRDESTVIGNIQPDLLGNISTTLSYKNLSLTVLMDYRIGGHVFSHGHMYNTLFGTMMSSLEYRDAENGGIEWTSQYTGNTYEDGIIPDGVFANGVIIEGVDVGGMSYQEAYDQGFVEPTHVSTHKARLGAWGSGISEEFTYENTWLSLREVVLSYRLPQVLTSKLSLQNVTVGVFGRDLGYIYSSIPDNMNLSLRSSFAGEFYASGIVPRIFTLGSNLQVKF